MKLCQEIRLDIPIELQDAEAKPSDRLFSTPERASATRRNVEDEGQVPHPKTRRLSEDVMDTGDGSNDVLTAMEVEIGTLSSDISAF